MTDLINRLTSLTRDLILIPSTDGHPEERGRAFQFFLNHLQSVPGLTLEKHMSDGYESLLAIPDDQPHPEILLCGHLDVVAHPDREQYTSSVRDGRIYGPGAGDMKGALAILLELFLKTHRERPGASLGLVITSDEEIGGMHGLRHLVEEKGLRCQVALIPDGGSLTEITVAEKGILHRRIRSHGDAAHAARPWLVENSLHRLITRLERLVKHFESLAPDQPSGRDHWYPTCSVTQLHTSNTSFNCIPDSAEATLDIRFPPPHSIASMEALVDDLLEIGDDLTIETIVGAEPTILDPDPGFVALTEEVTRQPVTRVRASGGSDARFLRAHGIPVLLSRPLVGNLHADDEWIDIESMGTYFTICDRYLQKRFQGIPS